MSLTLRQLHPHFVAEASEIDLREVSDKATLAQIRAAMDQYAVLVFRNQKLSSKEQMEFAQRFDGKLHTQSSLSVLAGNPSGNEGLSDIANVNEKGEIMARDDRRRMTSLCNRLWHTDASFVNPPGRYSLLLARVIPAERADTEFADMRAAYDALSDQLKKTVENLHVHHSIVYSRETLGFEFSAEEQGKLKGAVQPLVRTIPGSKRRALYLASHASDIKNWPIPEGRMLLHDLTEHATQREFVYQHEWREHDLVIWDNRATMHRGRPFDDVKHRRELTRVTTLDIEIVHGA